MKEHRFIELINLYIDRQISEAEASELERELQSNPGRRQVYQKYCRMHRATQVVYHSFRQQHDTPGYADPARRGEVVARFRRTKRMRFLGWSATLAAAACVTFVVVSRELAKGGKVDPAATVAAVPATPVPVVRPAVAAKTADVGMVSLRSPLVLEADYKALLATLRLEEQDRAARLGRQVPQAGQSLFADETFDARPALQDQRARLATERRNRANQPPTEFTAFEFQR